MRKLFLCLCLALLLGGCAKCEEPIISTITMTIPPMCSFTRGDRTIADSWPAFVGSYGELICREEDAPK